MQTLHLPPKKAIGNLKPEFVEERRKLLEDYLTDLCKDEILFQSETVAEFINIATIDSLQIILGKVTFMDFQNTYKKKESII